MRQVLASAGFDGSVLGVDEVQNDVRGLREFVAERDDEGISRFVVARPLVDGDHVTRGTNDRLPNVTVEGGGVGIVVNVYVWYMCLYGTKCVNKKT